MRVRDHGGPRPWGSEPVLDVACIRPAFGFRTSSNLVSADRVALTTWKKGREILRRRMAERILPLDDLIASIAEDPPQRVPGTAVYMDSNREGTPKALLHNLKHNRVLHDRVIMLTVVTADSEAWPNRRWFSPGPVAGMRGRSPRPPLHSRPGHR